MRSVAFSIYKVLTLWNVGGWEGHADKCALDPAGMGVQCLREYMSYILSGGCALNVHTANQVRRRGYQESGLNRSLWQRPHQDMPGIRELGDESGDMTRHAERTPLLDAATKSPRTS